MIEIRIHGRGGQGNVVAAYLLADAAFKAGHFCQAFPTFGAERRGAPVTAFVRVSPRKILRRNQVRDPDHMIVQDQTLLLDPQLTDGLKPPRRMLVNTTRDAAEMSDAFAAWVVTIPATQMAVEIVGRAVPNVALLSAFLTLTGMMPHQALKDALADRFHGDVLARNVALVDRAAEAVSPGLWQEAPHAASA